AHVSSTDVCTLSLHDALPISTADTLRHAAAIPSVNFCPTRGFTGMAPEADRDLLDGALRRFALIRTSTESGRPFQKSRRMRPSGDRKSTRLNSSHRTISYAVF